MPYNMWGYLIGIIYDLIISTDKKKKYLMIRILTMISCPNKGALRRAAAAVTHVTTEVGNVQGRVRDIEARQQMSGGDPWQQGGPSGAGNGGTTTGAPQPPQGQGAAAHQGATWHNMASD